MSDQIVLVFTMGRVGSIATHAAIHQVLDTSFHVHYLNPATLAKFQARPDPLPRNVRESLEALEVMRSSDAPVHVVTLVRDAIARNLSAAYTAWREALPESQWQPTVSDADQMSAFWASYYRETPIRWFDDQMKGGLGIDVYAHPFPTDAGLTRFQEAGHEVLVMHSDLSNSEKNQALRALTGLPVQVGIDNTNRASDSAKIRSTYEQFKATAPLTEDYVRSVAESRFMQHFFAIDPAEYVERWANS